jgi:hypothetical protein
VSSTQLIAVPLELCAMLFHSATVGANGSEIIDRSRLIARPLAAWVG